MDATVVARPMFTSHGEEHRAAREALLASGISLLSIRFVALWHLGSNPAEEAAEISFCTILC